MIRNPAQFIASARNVEGGEPEDWDRLVFALKQLIEDLGGFALVKRRVLDTDAAYLELVASLCDVAEGLLNRKEAVHS
ncbi:hypothetical protein [Planctomicrobium piriforme]|uniref:Uncharacterized protein n=1 Tax=Planctomicrobium piriforme TaxID=1576369 RepID=A0A1I3EIN7_9PLAN|nr:hypothetical protein [Planctomicrobium piriforme]SFH98581.1 hypothetical protein SAMN05421753_104231 [Planctomicrobium piriforme]